MDNVAQQHHLVNAGFPFPALPRMKSRGPYFRASDRKIRKNMIKLFDWLLGYPANSLLKDMHEMTGIPRKSLRNWRERLQLNPSWRPWKKLTNKDKMILTEREEFDIFDEINSEFLEKDMFCPQRVLRGKCLKTFNDRNVDPNKNFVCSYGYMRNFRKRTSLSLRHPAYSRRPEPDDNEIAEFIDKLTNAFLLYDPDHILNADETSVRLVPQLGFTLCKKGAKKAPNHIPCDTKKCFTANCTVSSTGKKLPIWFIAKGSNPSCTNVFGAHISSSRNQVSYSETGWVNKKIMKEYVEWLAEYYNNCSLCLLLDRFSAHIDNDVLKHASDHNIEIILVPSGLTSQYQPLDRTVYGVVKRIASAKWLQLYCQDMNHNFSQQEAAEMFIQAFNSVSTETIVAGWSFSFLE